MLSLQTVAILSLQIIAKLFGAINKIMPNSDSFAIFTGSSVQPNKPEEWKCYCVTIQNLRR